MQFDHKQAEALLAVIDTGSFEQAAHELHLTASAISQRVRQLETQLGTPLLVRSRPCRATMAGQQLLQYLRRARLLEQDFFASFSGEQSMPLSVPLAVNADTLSTWLLPALSDFLISENVLISLTVDDQDHTYSLMQEGQALACVSAEPNPMQGCMVHELGVLRYRMLASPVFHARWFGKGYHREAARVAPVMVFNRKDALQAGFLQQLFGLRPGSYPEHHVPASEPYLQSILLSLGYGMVPHLQADEYIARGELIDVAPQKPTDVVLYWHHWKVQSPRLERLSRRLVEAARQTLLTRLD
ncbi:LysR family transcriptional regulator ArgP [Chitinibacter bivalviorum]|uniref:LysR family transcriptional regulator ArgP n=1 Tax=Chitinibacter bivalviorum TaxID=2739434 RepID=A0A7H9BFE3_9NEIS|nr:LysR family transcriptional regulator ArgP [Chitinibacter bivalviorum]QLG87339.1 LysR family transcriptional regulator ArgP [Chitinibacter bivalviorum]